MKRFERKLGIAAAAVALLLLVTGASFAHHSAAAYDVETTIEVTGVVKTFRWKNPHTLVTLVVTGEDGAEVSWNFEGNGASNLVAAGWKRSMLIVGESATIIANPMKSGNPGGRLQGIELPDGTVVGDKY
jgi:hypothetical protein